MDKLDSSLAINFVALFELLEINVLESYYLKIFLVKIAYPKLIL